MSIRKQVEDIIKSEENASIAAMVILARLEDLGLSLEGNGWLDGDGVAQKLIYSDVNAIRDELR